MLITKKRVILRFGKSESAVDSCMRTSLLDLWICCFMVTAPSPHESDPLCVAASQDLRICESESAVDSCMTTGLLDLWICCYTVTAPSLHESDPLYVAASQDLRICESASLLLEPSAPLSPHESAGSFTDPRPLP